jgi:lysophospholipase L1-like esterase
MIVALLIGFAVVGLLGRAGWRLAQAAELARQSTPLQHRPSDPAMRLLIVGDSTAVGTGASRAEASLAGLLADAYPRLWIDNRSRDGATFADLAAQMAGAARHDMVLVQAGGNDVMRLRDLDVVSRDIDSVVARAAEIAPQIVLMPAGNVGNARFFFPPLSWLMTSRARRLHEQIRVAAARHGADYVDLFEERAADPFVQQPALSARDGLHPSDAGYIVWFEQLRRQARLDEVLAPARAP